MTPRILIIGGYGNFGSFIAKRLVGDADLRIIIGGRSEEKAKAFVGSLPRPADYHIFDYRKDFAQTLATVRPDIVIHTSGPFQNQDYGVARCCLAQKCHYIDLADGRAFVAGITELDDLAQKEECLLVSGASSVPCLTAAVVDKYIDQFARLERLDYGITTAQQTSPGLATARAVLSYAGKPFTTLIDGEKKTLFGWQDFHLHHLPGMGLRSFTNCDIPDLDIFPQRYPTLETIRFYAGIELVLSHFSLWLASWLVRAKIVSGLGKMAPFLLKISGLFNRFGSDTSGFYMTLGGLCAQGDMKEITFNLIARKGDGPYIPCVPAIILARKIAHGQITQSGATPCVGLIDFNAYMRELETLDIKWETSEKKDPG